MIEKIKSNWANKEVLLEVCIEIVERQLELSALIAQQESALDQAFVSEREDMYKGSDTLAKAKAKSLVGSAKTQYEYEFEALSNLLRVVTLRISQ